MAGAALDDHVQSKRGQLGYGLRNERDPLLVARCLPRNSDPHGG
jgi:hypothetical protein